MLESQQRGFTLIEVVVALAIAATALVVLLERLGLSATIQGTLRQHAILVESTIDVLERGRLEASFPQGGQTGDGKFGDVQASWKYEVRKTDIEGFERTDATVTIPEQGDYTLFLYRNRPGT